MKKLILCAAAAAALTGAGSVLAQPAECVVGILGAYTGDPCPNGQPRTQQQNNHSQDYRYRDGGALLSQIYGRDAYYPDGYRQPPRGPRYEPTRRDRDGDGVRNRDDRRPNDPRYR